MYGFLHLARLFQHFARFEFFTADTVRHFRIFATTVVAVGILKPLSGALLSVATSIGNDPGKVCVAAGVKDGQRIRLKGRGGPGRHGGPNGDLFVIVQVAPHPLFGRTGNNLTIGVPISFAEAALGATVTVPTVDGGSVKLKIPPGTSGGKTFRVPGRGVAGVKATGDLLVKVAVVVPPSMTDEQRKAVEALRSVFTDDPRRHLQTAANP